MEVPQAQLQSALEACSMKSLQAALAAGATAASIVNVPHVPPTWSPWPISLWIGVVAQGWTEAVRLLAPSADWGAATLDDLQAVVCHGHLPTFQAVVHAAPPSERQAVLDACLWPAAGSLQYETVLWLMDEGADPTTRRGYESVLCRSRTPEIARLLLQRGVDANGTGVEDEDQRPLAVAASLSADVWRVLRNAGAELTAGVATGALKWAALRPRGDSIWVLAAHGVDVEPILPHAIHKALRQDDDACALALVKMGMQMGMNMDLVRTYARDCPLTVAFLASNEPATFG